MSTANFSSPTLSCVYAIGMNQYNFDEIKKQIADDNDEPIEEISDTRVSDYINGMVSDDFDYDLERIKDAIDKKTNFYTCDEYLWRDKRAIARIEIEYYDREYKNWSEVSLYVTIESWYYEGAMIDMNLDDIANMEEAYHNKTFQKKINRAVKSVEDILKVECLKLRKAYQFSNWEAGYSIIK